jgi:hypothetical protein
VARALAGGVAHEDARRGESLQGLLDESALDPGVRAGADGDLVLAARVDDDQRGPCGLAGERPQLAGRDTLLHKPGPSLLTEGDGADEGDGRAEPRRGHGGIGALAASETLHAPPQHRLPGPREFGRSDDEVDVGRADHDEHVRHGDAGLATSPSIRRRRGAPDR